MNDGRDFIRYRIRQFDHGRRIFRHGCPNGDVHSDGVRWLARGACRQNILLQFFILLLDARIAAWIEPRHILRPGMRGIAHLADFRGSDIVVCDFLLEWENVTKHAIQNIGNSKEDFLKLVLSFNTSVGLCNKMFKREIYIDHNIKAIDGCNMGEDFMICSQLVYYSNKIAKIDSPLYHYIQTNNTSYTKNITKKSIKSVVEILNHLTLFFEEKTDYNSYREFLLKGKLRKKIEFFMFSTLKIKVWR